MRLIYITDARIPTEKAHGYQIMKMCEAFAELGLEVDLVVPRLNNPIVADAFLLYGIPHTFRIHYLTIPSMPRGWLFPASLIPHVVGLIFFIRAARRFVEKSADAKTVIYTRSGVLAFFLSRYATVTYEVHGFSRTSFFFRRSYAVARYIVAMTEGIRFTLLRRGVLPDKIIIAHDAVDLRLFSDDSSKMACRVSCGLPLAADIVGYVGRFTVFNKDKGIPILIRAVGHMHKKRPMVRLLLVGGPASCIPSYMRIADDCGLRRENIIYVPAVSPRDVPRYMQSCDVLVIPLPYSLFSSVYTSPLKMFEYMASGVPIVASDLPALREIINEKNALFARAGDEADLARALSVIFNDPLSASTRARQAHHDVRAYTWHNRALDIAGHMRIIQ